MRLGYRGAGSVSDRDIKEDVTPPRCLHPACDAGPSEGRIAHAGENEGKTVLGFGRDGDCGSLLKWKHHSFVLGNEV